MASAGSARVVIVGGAIMGSFTVWSLRQAGFGAHDAWPNQFFATGFSGHGVMHAPAVGRGIAELITTGGYQTIDLEPLGWARIRNATPLVESIVY